MPTCSAKISSAPLHTNHEENCGHDGKYNGYYRFNQDQLYDGEFFRNSMHGEGTYKWNDLAVYEGYFYSNFKEGYASLSFLDNSYFEGLFIKNQPFGPGILTYSNGRQDAGFWLGRKLVRLSRAVDYIIPRLAPTSAAKIKLLQFRRLIPLNEKGCDSVIDILKKTGCQVEPICGLYSSLIYDPRSIFFEKEVFEKTYFINLNKPSKEFTSDSTNWEISNGYSEEDVREKEESKSQIRTIPGHCLCPQDVFVMEYKNRGDTDICDSESYKEEYEMGILANFTKYGTIEGLVDEMGGIKSDSEILSGNFIEGEEEAEETREDKSTVPKIVSWNRSEICTEMIKQIFRYRAFEGKLSFNLGKLMLGARTAFRRTGKLEKQCVQFLKMCSLGPAHIVKELLCSFEIDEELMDARGNNSLMFAAATDQHEVIDILLDFGVDVNTFNDESLTPLNLCLLRRLAQANGICNWETAFLPKEIDKTMISESFAQGKNFESPQSIPSLDRIFGDGMSITKSSDSYEKISASENVTQSLSDKALEESGNFSSFSQITLIELLKSQQNKSLLLPDMEGKTRKVQKYSSASRFQRLDELAEVTGSTVPTPQINIHIIPKSNKREEFEKSVQQRSTDKYLFGFTFEKKPNVGGNKGKTVSAKSNKGKASKSQREEPKEENLKVERTLGLEITEKIAEIDKTIVKLLQRGADPNISEVPKPSIHLGVYTKDLNTVYTLLLHGASPDCQLYSNEGLLTPLHVIVLQKPAQEYVDICELLLEFGANSDKETDPEFSLCEEEKDFLSPEQGRTPLQLLCMRPDLEYENLNDSLITIGLMLAKVSDKRHFYKGHSCLTLAMRSNNLKLLEALLESKYYDPNEILEEDIGTALHFLVSTELQKNTTYETSTKICDLLIAAGANPLKKFKRPKKLKGTCTDYGYREVEAEKEKRKLNASGKKVEKITGRDYLKDHEKVVDYLGAIALEMAEKKATKHGTGSRKKEYQEPFKKQSTRQKASGRNDEKSAKSINDREESKDNVESTTGKDRIKDKRQKRTGKEVNDDLKKDNSELEEDEGRKRFGEKKKKNVKSEKEEEDEGKGKAKDNKSKKKDEDRDEDKDIESEKEDEDEGKAKAKDIKSKRKAKDDDRDKGSKRKDEDRDENKDIKSKKKDKDRDEDKGIKSKRKDDDRDKGGKRKDDDRYKGGKKKDEDRDEDKGIKSKKKDKDYDRDKGSKRKDENRDEDKDIKSKKKDKDRDEDKGIKSKKKDKGRDEDKGIKSKRKDDDGDKGSKGKDEDRDEDKGSKGKDEDRDEDKGIKSKKKDKNRDEDKGIKSKKKDEDKDKDAGSKRNLEETKTSKKNAGKISERDQPLREKHQEKDKDKISWKKHLEEESKKPGSNLPKLTKSPSKNLSIKKLRTRSETFPEKLRRTFLRLYGSCTNIDINEFLVPYVVLRNGELYYRFQGKANQKEQYSLI